MTINKSQTYYGDLFTTQHTGIFIKHSSKQFGVEIEIISETKTAYAISNYRCALTVRTVLQLRMTRNISLRFHTSTPTELPRKRTRMYRFVRVLHVSGSNLPLFETQEISLTEREKFLLPLFMIQLRISIWLKEKKQNFWSWRNFGLMYSRSSYFSRPWVIYQNKL